MMIVDNFRLCTVVNGFSKMIKFDKKMQYQSFIFFLHLIQRFLVIVNFSVSNTNFVFSVGTSNA